MQRGHWRETETIFGPLLDLGYQAAVLTPVFDRAIMNAQKYLSQTEAFRQQIKDRRKKASKRRVYFHLPFHPSNPPSHELQQLWRRHISCPVGKKQLNRVKSPSGALIPVDSMIIAYSRAPNIGNLLSYRKICKRSGPKVSSYLWLDISKPRFIFLMARAAAGSSKAMRKIKFL